ncbi:M20 family metallo-hydrolase [Salinicoccus sp. ID82-1]|uniref:M20 family metallo-hydrolase n=1 Tax=Salinicoccus sp. ID82-1 TaxID=2820269 RepID=UPI001F44252F|nr:M20 family metallo-hydrolase [Salinicoccus sp. ID82-1]MCG1008528.1 M20 family metallo-hydrolase [Salinicoccus sp. ID82-1]
MDRAINASRLSERLHALSRIGKIEETGVNRLALSATYKEGMDLVRSWMDDAGLATRYDNFGNLIGRIEGKKKDAPAVMLGSHIDSQPYGGRFDGTIGVLGGLEAVQTMIENGIEPDVPIEVMSFCDEEGHRFGVGLFGSRGITGQLDPGELERTDKDGITRREALIEFGADPDQLEASVYDPSAISAYLEMHIEQGPNLEALDQPVGIVSGIAGPRWMTVELTGISGHAGTVPMEKRQDPLVGASYIIAAFNGLVQSEAGAPSVGTVGSLDVFPGGRSIIPERVTFTIDLRDSDLNRRDTYEAALENIIDKTAFEYSLEYTIYDDGGTTPKDASENIISIMKDESRSLGLEPPVLMSGAFHDASNMADICDMGMIFVRCKDGISHNPAEYASDEDIAAGTELLYRTMLKLVGK